MPTIQKRTRSVLSNGYLRIPKQGEFANGTPKKIAVNLGGIQNHYSCGFGESSCWGRHSSYSLASELAITFWGQQTRSRQFRVDGF